MKLSELQTHRAAGVLLGTAAGDALGAGYEFTHPTVGTAVDMIGGGAFNWAPGEWTDDTSMALGIAQAAADGVDIRSGPGFDAVAARFVEWVDTKPADIGNQTRTVLQHRSQSAVEMQRRAGELQGRTAGNGSLMRTAPVALAYLDDAQACIDAAAAISSLTHYDERAIQACKLWSFAIRHAVLEGDLDGVALFLDQAEADVADFWRPLITQAETGTPSDFSNNGWVVHALQTAWWAITNADSSGPQHLQTALEMCVLAGGDTDTTAAIVGGLLGARWGASAIPARWRRILHGYPGLRADDLVRLAVKVANKGGDDREGWPSVNIIDYSRYRTHNIGTHPHDSGVTVSGADFYRDDKYDAVVSLCRVGRAPIRGEHIQFWLIDSDGERNANLEFVLEDAAQTVRQLREEGKTVLLHCVEGRSRTPSVAARYSVLLGRNPNDVLKAMSWAKPKRSLWKVATETRRSAGPIVDVVEGDITTLSVEAIVNAANRRLLGGGGVDGAIHRAGGPAILEACKVLRATTLPDGLTVGAAVATTAGKLHAHWVIHAVGPRYSASEDRSELLRAAYTRSLALADSLGLGSIAFPLISGGSYGWPKTDDIALQVKAVTTAHTSVGRITLVAYSPELAQLTRKLLKS